MNQILEFDEYVIATVLLSIIHGSIPNHWLPFVVISKTNYWTIKKLSFVSIIGGFFHSLSTTLLGIFISALGYYSMSNFKELKRFLPTFFMVFLGMVYILNQNHIQHEIPKSIKENKNTYVSLLLLYLAMFFSPCLEIEAIYFSIGQYGIEAVILISILYTVLSSISIVIFSLLSYYGYSKYYPKILEKYEKRIVGLILIILGIISFYY